MRGPLQLISLDNPRLKRVMHLRKHRDRRDSGLFVAEGLREIERALTAGVRVVELFWSPLISNTRFDQLPAVMPGLPESMQIYDVTPAVMGKIAYREKPEGYLAVAEAPRWRLDDLEIGRHPLFLIASDIEKPGNLGAMARTAAAAGATALLVADEQVDAFNPNAIRASTGAVFSLPILSDSTDRLLAFLRAHEVRLFAAAPGATRPHCAADFRGPTALAIGAEDVGLSAPWLAAADASGGRVSILMPNTTIVDSLNASVAAGVLLFEAVRQRQERPLP